MFYCYGFYHIFNRECEYMYIELTDTYSVLFHVPNLLIE